MFDFIKAIFRNDPGKKIQKKIAVKNKHAMQLQRDGNLREYANVMKEIEVMEEEYIRIHNESR